MKKPFKINHLNFDSQVLAIEHFKSILNRYNIGDSLIGMDYVDVESLIFNHPSYEEKIGCGIKNIVIRNDSFNGKCFHIIRKNDTVEDFSYIKCIKGNPSLFSIFSKACRKSISNDTIEFKIKFFSENGNSSGKIMCPICNELIDIKESHVDHYPKTFSNIVYSFVKENNLNLSEIEYVKENTYGKELKDINLAEKFKEYHRNIAQYRIIKASCNLKLSYIGKLYQN